MHFAALELFCSAESLAKLRVDLVADFYELLPASWTIEFLFVLQEDIKIPKGRRLHFGRECEN